MNTKAKRNKQLESIKKKLTAATCMLLVASTMMVSSTYAWFTLSTAPEVTGISTTVGANGSLEIALASGTDIGGADITSKVGDSMSKDGVPVTYANTTWGNLVDLDDASYGLKNIVLYPAALNEYTESSVDKVTLEAPLKTPQYGADGRVVELSANTTYANYKNGAWDAAAKEYGVRAIGALSGQSATDIAFNESTAMLAQQSRAAKNAAEFALQANGTTLGNIIIRKATGGEDKYTKAEMDALKSLMDGYVSALAEVATGLKYVAYGRAASSEFTDNVKFDAIKLAIEAGKTVEEVLAIFYGTVTGEGDAATVTPKTDFATDTELSDNGYALLTAYNKYKTTLANVNAGIAKYETVVKDATADTTFTFEQVQPVLNYLVVYNNVKVNGFAASELMTDEGKQSLAESVVGGNGINVEMPKGSGVVADLAELAGNYYASIKFDKVSAMGMTVNNVTARLVAETDVHDGEGHLVENSDKILVQGKKETATEGGDDLNFTDTYAYIVDLYFRTNAQNSNLQLQTTPVDRVYENQEGAVTMGGGSTISFTADKTVFTEQQMRALMGCVRVIFIDTASGEILSRGTLVAPGQPATEEGNNITLSGDVYLTTKDGQILPDKSVLTSLTANEAKMVSVMVYLDGTVVDNSMVANALTSMTGTLNLQFSSSADLVPMENNQIKELTDDDTNKTPATEYDITKAVAEGVLVGKLGTDGVTAAEKAAAGEDIVIFVPSTITNPTVTVTGTQATGPVENPAVPGGVLYTFKMPAEAVTVTVEAGV